MASSSSAKKVARVAAKSGSGAPVGKDPAKSKNWLFYGGIFLIVALGAGIVLFARDKNEGAGANTTAPKANLQDGEPYDHWHAAFAISVCGTEVAALQDGPTDVLGIHTHGDSLIHIHPFTRSASGERATLGKYFPQVGIKVTDTGFQLPDGLTLEDGSTTVKEGETTCGGEEGELVLAKWADATTAIGSPPDKIYRENFADVRFLEDYSAFTLAFVPVGSEDIEAPASSAEIETLGAADGGAPAPTSAGGSTETIPTETLPATDETVPAEETPTTAAGAAE